MSAPKTIGEKMTRSIHSIGSDQPLAQAHRIMRANGIRHLPVLAAGNRAGTEPRSGTATRSGAGPS